MLNAQAETTAKQMILIRSMMGDKCEDITYNDYVPYPYLETAKKSKLKLKKWEAQVILSQLDTLELDMQTVVKKDLAYFLKTAEVF